MKPLHDAALVVRDAMYSALVVRKGEVLTEEVCRERANNACHYVIEALIEGIRAKIGAVPQSIGIETTPAGRRFFEDDTAIGTVREPATKGERNA
jgi:hypothetical protein